jgi:hypothetical protein
MEPFSMKRAVVTQQYRTDAVVTVAALAVLVTAPCEQRTCGRETGRQRTKQNE